MPLHVHFPRAHPVCRSHLAALNNAAIAVSFDGQPHAETAILIDGRPAAELLGSLAFLQAVIIPWSGVPHQAREVLGRFPHLRVHNLHHNAQATAETAFALMLAAAKRVVPLDRLLRRNDWSPRYDARSEEAMLLAGRNALVIGAGAVGSRIASMCEAFGMKTTAVGRSQSSGVRTLLPQADVLFVTVPESDATRGMLGSAEIGLLPQHAILINVARGAVVDEQSLYEAQRDGRIGGAALDVWWRYPEDEASRDSTPPSRFPFRGLDNVVMSPHRAGHSDQTERMRADAIAALLSAAAQDETMPNRVDIERGY